MSVVMEEDRVSEVPGAPASVRVSLREVRELSYRALIVDGASGGEAALAAEQVLATELVHGCGLAAVVADVATGRWSRTGLDLRAEPPVLIADGGSSLLPLRTAGLLADLAVADPGTWVFAPELEGSEVLVAAAVHAVADAGVSLGVGWNDRAVVVTPTGVGAGQLAPPGWERRGCWFHAPPEAPPCGPPDPWSSLAQRRHEAAAGGVVVDASLWTRIKELARGYLVPES